MGEKATYHVCDFGCGPITKVRGTWLAEDEKVSVSMVDALRGIVGDNASFVVNGLEVHSMGKNMRLDEEGLRFRELYSYVNRRVINRQKKWDIVVWNNPAPSQFSHVLRGNNLRDIVRYHLGQDGYLIVSLGGDFTGVGEKFLAGIQEEILQMLPVVKTDQECIYHDERYALFPGIKNTAFVFRKKDSVEAR